MHLELSIIPIPASPSGQPSEDHRCYFCVCLYPDNILTAVVSCRRVGARQCSTFLRAYTENLNPDLSRLWLGHKSSGQVIVELELVARASQEVNEGRC